jgi:hypothetical protein
MAAEHLNEEVECQGRNADFVSEPREHELGEPEQDLVPFTLCA